MERRSTKIDVSKAIAWMEANALDYLNGDTYLYRGIKDDPALTFADTDAGEPRKSIGNMANYYTLWMSYNPEWKGKPRRERSFIASSSREDARTWGSLNLLVPSKSSKVGAVGENDIWNKYLTSELRLARVTTHTRALLGELGFENKFSTYAELAEAFKSLSMDTMVEALRKHSYMFDNEFVAFIEDQFLKGKAKNLFEIWEILFSPEKFEFMTTSNIKGGGEFWVDGQAIYIPLTTEIDSEDQKTLLAWAEEKSPNLAKLLKIWV